MQADILTMVRHAGEPVEKHRVTKAMLEKGFSNPYGTVKALIEQNRLLLIDGKLALPEWTEPAAVASA